MYIWIFVKAADLHCFAVSSGISVVLAYPYIPFNYIYCYGAWPQVFRSTRAYCIESKNQVQKNSSSAWANFCFSTQNLGLFSNMPLVTVLLFSFSSNLRHFLELRIVDSSLKLCQNCTKFFDISRCWFHVFRVTIVTVIANIDCKCFENNCDFSWFVVFKDSFLQFI